jgi:5-methylthioadenosine/S-adenosylhomocysteine deaminase
MGPASEVAEAHPDLPERDLGELIVAPGMVDAHCHLEWSLTGALVPVGRFAGFLGGLLRLRTRMQPADHAVAAALGALRCLESGTTTVADSGPTGRGVTALVAAGLRGVVHLEAFGRQEGSAATDAARALADRVAALEASAGSRVRVGVSPHAPYSVGPGLWRALSEHPGLGSRPWATHLAESPEEARLMARGDGPLRDVFQANGLEPARWPGEGLGPVARLVAAGALRAEMVAAHCIHLGPGGVEALRATGVAVAHCPISNARLRCGRAPLADLRAAGVPVGLGTDSPASAGHYDLRAEARACGLVGAAAPDAAQLLALATAGGAEALGLGREIGTLEPGKRCDLIAIEPGREVEGGEPCAVALDPTSRVVLVVVDGRVVLDRAGATLLDHEAVLAAASEVRARLC